MDILDLVIIAILALSAFIGFSRGLIRPLIAQSGAIVALAVLAHNPGLLNSVVPPFVPRVAIVGVVLFAGGFVFGIAGRVIGAIADRIPVVRTIDKPAGVIFTTVLSFVLIYVVISGLVTFDAALEPIHRSVQVGNAQVAQLRKNLASTPGVGLLMGNNSLDQMQTDSSHGAVPVTSLGQYDGWIGFYENTLRPQLVGSALAPTVLAIGERIPVVGHHQAFPQAQSRNQAPS